MQYLVLRVGKGLRANLVVEREDVLFVEGDPPHHQAVQGHAQGPNVGDLQRNQIWMNIFPLDGLKLREY